jgi:hypothetical protein
MKVDPQKVDPHTQCITWQRCAAKKQKNNLAMHDSVHLLTLRAFIAVGNLKGVRAFFFKIRVFFFFK